MGQHETGGKYGHTVGYKGGAFYKASTTPGYCYLCQDSHLYQYPCALLLEYEARIQRKARRRGAA